MSIRRIVTVTLVVGLATLLAAGCGGDGDSSGEGDYANEVVRERDGLRLRFASDRATYGEAQPVRLIAQIENLTQVGVLYGSAADPSNTAGFSFFVDNVFTGSQDIAPEERTEDETGGTMVPGGSTNLEVDWDQLFASYVTPIQAPEGLYTINASIVVKPQGAIEPIEITAALEVSLEGGEAIPTSEVVIQATLAQEELKDWFEGRGDSVACTGTRVGIYYNALPSTGTIVETFDFVYQAQIANGGVICSTVTEGENWRVIFNDGSGEEPLRVSAILELNTADFIRLEEGGPTPTRAAPFSAP